MTIASFYHMKTFSRKARNPDILRDFKIYFCDYKTRSIEIIQSEKHKEKGMTKNEHSLKRWVGHHQQYT